MLEEERKWQDRKRYFGLPISFTKYSLSSDRVFCEKGLLNITEEQIPLYRVRDVQLSCKWHQRLFGVGSVTVISSDPVSPKFVIENIRNPKGIKEQIYSLSEEAKRNRRMISADVSQDEFMDRIVGGGD